MSRFSFNKIYVIESLQIEEVQTGANLYNDLLRWKVQSVEGLDAEHSTVKTRKDLFDNFETIRNEITASGRLPFIHFEIHGDGEKRGLVLSSGQLITWGELATRLREINILTNHNLFVSLATCFGAYIYREIRLTEKAPFWGFVAPWTETFPDDVEISFNAFFDSLLESKNFNDAIDRLNSSFQSDYRFHFYHAEDVFDRVYQQYEDRDYSPENFRLRVAHLTRLALVDEHVRSSFTPDQVRTLIERMLIDDKDAYRERYRRNFLDPAN